MADRKGSIFKISGPTLDGIFHRKRLYPFLSGTPSQPVTWVFSPAGSGKTTLVADYLKHHSHPAIWYQMDQRDEDPAAFFYYLAMAVKQATPKKRKSLPLFTQEHLLGLNTFALSYFEAVFQRLHIPTVLVIDNYQLIPRHSMLHQAICNGLSIIPEGIKAIVISRDPPPPNFSRMLANRKMSLLEWSQLRLTQEETDGVVNLHAHKELPEDIVSQLHNAADGWIAGLVLMLAQIERHPIDWPSIKAFSPEEIAEYFSNEVFERESLKIQHVLLKAAFLPYMTEKNLRQLTGQKQAGWILMELNRKHRFTERYALKSLAYKFHPLFREFLLKRAGQAFSEAELASVRGTAARLIEQEGDFEEAAELVAAANDWDALARIIVKQAFGLYEQGRYTTLLDWLQQLPDRMIQENPWLSYWQGASLLPFDASACRSHLERAFEGFRVLKKDNAMLLVWAEIVAAIYYSMTDYSPLDHWIALLEEQLAESPHFPSQTIEARVTAAMFLALNCRQLHHPDIKMWADRASALLAGPLDINIKVLLINNIILYHLYVGDFDKATEAMDMLGPAIFTNVSMPMVTLISTIIKGNYYLLVGEHDLCMKAITSGLEKLKAAGLQLLDILVEGYGAWSAMTHGDYTAVREHLKQKSAIYESARPFEHRLFLTLTILEALSRGDLNRANKDAQTLMKICMDVGAPFNIMMAYLIQGLVMHESKNDHPAAEALDQAMRMAETAKARLITFYGLMLQARFALDRNRRTQGITFLRQAMALGRSRGIYNHVVDIHSQVSRLFVLSLEEGIEEAYACECIRRLDLTPEIPPVHLENWPWAIKIYTLGTFSLVLNGEEKIFPGRVKAKPLELLKVLIAQGGREVPEETLSDYLWPDADGDLAHTSFNTTLHRLRQLLGHDRALQLKAGKLTLDPCCCWVDVWAFEQFIKNSNGTLHNSNLDGDSYWAQKAINIYPGPFLPGDNHTAWSVALREKLKSQFLAILVESARQYEQQGDYEKAVELYQKGLSVDDLLEPFYQGLMLCLKHLGRPTEAIAVYQRCQKTLSASLGIAPSRQTEIIFQSL